MALAPGPVLLLPRRLRSAHLPDLPARPYAARLHPALFGGVEQAKKAFQRLFRGHFPIKNTHRGMSPKSAAYRRGGRGHGSQRAWWLEGDAEAARGTLEAAL